MHPFQSEWLAAAHQEELTTAAELRRLRPAGSGHRVVLGWLGGLLIRMGERLQPAETAPAPFILPRST
ncbi:MAG TPA: hypothetical protein VGI06_12410 [Acidimicrobiales bacterium]